MHAFIPNHHQAYLLRIAAQCHDEIPVCVHEGSVHVAKIWFDGVFLFRQCQGRPVLDIALVQFLE